MGKSFGPMVSEDEAMGLLNQICGEIDIHKKENGFGEKLGRMKNLFAYLADQAKPVSLKYHKGKYGRKYDYWTCRNCGCEITHGVVQNFCWNCGHRLAWDSPRCLTGEVEEEEKDEGGYEISGQ